MPSGKPTDIALALRLVPINKRRRPDKGFRYQVAFAGLFRRFVTCIHAVLYGWSPGIGDPTIFGWAVVAGYFAAFLLCLRAGQVHILRDGRLCLWHVLAAAMFLLGVNKQLDLQTLFTDAGRTYARDLGIYDQRRSYQAVFIALLAFSASAAAIFVSVRAVKSSWQLRIATGGLIVLFGFVVIRAASFHYVDRMLGWDLGGVLLNHVVESLGIALVGIPAALAPSTRNWLHSRRTTRSGTRPER